MKDDTMWVTVHKQFDGWLAPTVMQTLEPGEQPQQVRRVIGEAAIAAGCATEVAAPARDPKAKA